MKVPLKLLITILGLIVVILVVHSYESGEEALFTNPAAKKIWTTLDDHFARKEYQKGLEEAERSYAEAKSFEEQFVARFFRTSFLHVLIQPKKVEIELEDLNALLGKSEQTPEFKLLADILSLMVRFDNGEIAEASIKLAVLYSRLPDLPLLARIKFVTGLKALRGSKVLSRPVPGLEKSLRALPSLHPNDRLLRAISLIELSGFETDTERAKQSRVEARAMLNELKLSESILHGTLLVDEGSAELHSGNFEVARTSFREALVISQRQLDACHPSTANIQARIFEALLQLNRMKEADEVAAEFTVRAVACGERLPVASRLVASGFLMHAASENNCERAKQLLAIAEPGMSAVRTENQFGDLFLAAGSTHIQCNRDAVTGRQLYREATKKPVGSAAARSAIEFMVIEHFFDHDLRGAACCFDLFSKMPGPPITLSLEIVNRIKEYSESRVKCEFVDQCFADEVGEEPVLNSGLRQ
jgi:hypothetical protein